MLLFVERRYFDGVYDFRVKFIARVDAIELMKEADISHQMKLINKIVAKEPPGFGWFLFNI